jgi:hypothetical protein
MSHAVIGMDVRETGINSAGRPGPTILSLSYLRRG